MSYTFKTLFEVEKINRFNYRNGSFIHRINIS